MLVKNALGTRVLSQVVTDYTSIAHTVSNPSSQRNAPQRNYGDWRDDRHVAINHQQQQTSMRHKARSTLQRISAVFLPIRRSNLNSARATDNSLESCCEGNIESPAPKKPKIDKAASEDNLIQQRCPAAADAAGTGSRPHHASSMSTSQLDTYQPTRYQVECRLQVGSTSTVYLATDTQRKTRVALKRIRSDVVRASDIMREINVHRQLEHRHIAQYYGVQVRRVRARGMSGATNFTLRNPYSSASSPAVASAPAHHEVETTIVMEYCEGGDLLSWISPESGLPAEEVWRLAAQVASAIEYLHDMNIVHRDLKSDNIALNEQGDAKLIDFGAAQSIEDIINAPKPHLVYGTYAYSAPEYIKGYADCATIDLKAVDMYAFGICLFSWCSSSFPYRHASMSVPDFALFCQAGPLSPMSRTAHIWRRIPASLRVLICGLMNPNPKDRWDIHQACSYIESMSPSGL